jgi:hypothetical protein
MLRGTQRLDTAVDWSLTLCHSMKTQHCLRQWGMKPTVLNRRHRLDFHTLALTYWGPPPLCCVALDAVERMSLGQGRVKLPTRVKDVGSSSFLVTRCGSAVGLCFTHTSVRAMSDYLRMEGHRTPPWLPSQGFSGFDITRGDLGMVTHTRARVRCMRGLSCPPQHGGGTGAGGRLRAFG